MISDLHFKNLDTANRELSCRFEKLKKARQSRHTRHQASRDGILSVVAAPLHRRARCRCRGNTLIVMFTKPIDEITFEDVKSFCNEWAESVRVEYKRDINLKRHIPKIVSSFANTYGGLFLIGVEADQKNNRVSSIPGIPPRNGIEEQIQQSALTGIYPGVIPEIKLVDVPNSGNVVVVVRVDESVQAPHAIEGSTKVYIRTGSITHPHKLSDMDRITYMLKRREDSQVVVQQILTRIRRRANRDSLRNMSSLTVIAHPVFPYRPVISPPSIYELRCVLPAPLRRVDGGVSYVKPLEYLELK